jgi:hypothetical protein
MQDGPSQHDERKMLKGRWRLLMAVIFTSLSLAATSVWNGVITGGIGVARGATWEMGKGLWTTLSNATDGLFHRHGADKPVEESGIGPEKVPPKPEPEAAQGGSGSTVKVVVDDPVNIPTMKGR